ncbi:MAG: M28 family metallopeptidase [Parvularculaceae bacterium]
MQSMWNFRSLIIASGVAAAAIVAPGQGMAQEEPLDYNAINEIRDQAFNHSEVMETLGYMTDVIGPRLTGSPQMREANDWALEKFAEWGLRNGRLEAFEFGPGWTYSKVSVRMMEPRIVQLQAYPVSWHPGTNGPVQAEVILAAMESEDDFDEYRGKLEGKIVLLSGYSERGEPSNNVFTRRSEENLESLAISDVPVGSPPSFAQFADLFTFQAKLFEFLRDEGAVAAVRRSPRDAALIEASGYLHREGRTPEVPLVSVSTEDYERMLRLLDRDIPVAMEVEVEAEYHTEDMNSYNSLADIPGTTREIVMAGAHFDSWFVGDGAVDNGAGSAVVMEAARILAALDFRPRRTIRFALWGGEEQGLFGSAQHVRAHYGDRPAPADEELADLPAFFWFNTTWPVTPGRDHGRLSAYFNLDNGSGRIRGIYGEGNAALKPIFERWFEPFHDVEAKTVSLNGTGGTDHLFFQWVGLPAFQFIQDPLDYGARLHHTQIDTYDHVYEADLKQASAIMASFLYHAAMREERLPRKPLPSEPPNSGGAED